METKYQKVPNDHPLITKFFIEMRDMLFRYAMHEDRELFGGFDPGTPPLTPKEVVDYFSSIDLEPYTYVENEIPEGLKDSGATGYCIKRDAYVDKDWNVIMSRRDWPKPPFDFKDD